MLIIIMFLLVAVAMLSVKIIKLQRQVDQLLSRDQLIEALDSFMSEVKKENEQLIKKENENEETAFTVVKDEQPHNNVIYFKNQEKREHVLSTHTKERFKSGQASMTTNQHITNLSNEGLSTADIAKALKLGVREVDLILQIEKRKQ